MNAFKTCRNPVTKNKPTELVRKEMKMINCTSKTEICASKTEYICKTRIDNFSLENGGNETFACVAGE